jgi:uncharacterized delta-60 repeat protein
MEGFFTSVVGRRVSLKGGWAEVAGGHAVETLEPRVLLAGAVSAAAEDCGCGAFAGDLDPTFGQGGGAVIGFPTSRLDHAASVVVAGNRVIVAGYSNASSQQAAAFGRYDLSGRPDAAFGAGGRVLADAHAFGSSNFRLWAAVSQPGGKLVAAGTDENSTVSLVRFNADGTPDRSFGTQGVALARGGFGSEVGSLRATPAGDLLLQVSGETQRFSRDGRYDPDFGDFGRLFGSVLVQPDGKIVVSDGSLRRLNRDGTPDRSFAGGAPVDTGLGGADGLPALLPGGRILVGGLVETADGGERKLVLKRYNANGTLDTRYGSRGMLDTGVETLTLGSDEPFFTPRAVVMADGRVVVLGARQGHFVLARFTADGAADRGFPTAVLPADPVPADLGVAPDGSVFVAGTREGATRGTAEPTGDFALLRFTPFGRRDAGFGGASGGLVTADFLSDTGRASAAALAPDGKLVILGSTGEGFEPLDGVLVRVNRDGSPDRTFGQQGLVRREPTQTPSAVAVQRDGKVLVGTSVVEHPDRGGTDFAVTRYNADGTLDRSFGTGGTARTDFGRGEDDDVLRRLLVQPDGKILAAGGSAGNASAIARYNANGTLDRSFGNGGKAVTSFGTGDASAGALGTGIALYPDGRIIVAGMAGIDISCGDGESACIHQAAFALARYTAAGRPDNTFGRGGKVQGPSLFDIRPLRAAGVSVLASGAVVVGAADRGAFTLAKFDRSGKLDATFGKSGVAAAPFALDRTSNVQMAATGDGKFVLAAESFARDAAFSGAFLLSRFNADGSLDRSFGRGTARALLPGDPTLAALLAQPDGKLVAVGSVEREGRSGIALARFRGDGPPAPPADPAPARLVRDLAPGPDSGFESARATLGGTVYFTVSTPQSLNLWKTDGTAVGTSRVSSLNVGDVTAVSGMVLFNTFDGATTTLWRTGGTGGPVSLRRGLRLRSAVSVSGKTVFAADSSDGSGVWRTDGTAAGTSLLWKGSAGELTVVGSRVFFSGDDGRRGQELWASDGTARGTVLVKELSPGIDSSNPRGLLETSGRLLFTAEDASHGDELWVSDGTARGTFLLADIAAGVFGSSPEQFTRLGTSTYFVATTGDATPELWRTNGTRAGTVRVAEVPFGVSNMVASGRRLFFAVLQSNNVYELWTSDGTGPGTRLLRGDFRQGDGPLGQQPDNFTDLNGTLYFTAGDPLRGRELWKSNGTIAGTTVVRDINPGPAGSRPFALTVAGGRLMFTADDGARGNEVWTSDGTAAGTRLLAEIQPGRNGSNPGDFSFLGLFTVAGSNVFFAATDDEHGRELWVVPVGARPR